jgi:hypothetical protein
LIDAARALNEMRELVKLSRSEEPTEKRAGKQVKSEKTDLQEEKKTTNQTSITDFMQLDLDDDLLRY